MNSLKQKYGSWALITGASSGIGRTISEQLAAQGLNVIPVARSTEKLTDLSKGWDLEKVQVHLEQSRVQAKDCEDCESQNGHVHLIEKN